MDVHALKAHRQPYIRSGCMTVYRLPHNYNCLSMELHVQLNIILTGLDHSTHQLQVHSLYNNDCVFNMPLVLLNALFLNDLHKFNLRSKIYDPTQKAEMWDGLFFFFDCKTCFKLKWISYKCKCKMFKCKLTFN